MKVQKSQMLKTQENLTNPPLIEDFRNASYQILLVCVAWKLLVQMKQQSKELGKLAQKFCKQTWRRLHRTVLTDIEYKTNQTTP